MKTIRNTSLSDKVVLIRVDFNVPLDEQQKVTDDSRIRGVLPTVNHAIDQGAKVVLASHLGRPKGKVVPAFSLKPVAARLEELVGRRVLMAEECVGEPVERMIREASAGEIVLLENLRFHPEEEKNDEAFARSLADLCDVYVNDAFAVSHRSNASVDAITRFAPESVAGLLMEKELTYFEKAMKDPARPFAAIVGGAKVSGKLGALKNLMQNVDRILIGGAMANTFLRARGLATGRSLVETDLVETAREILKEAASKGVTLLLPVDVVVAGGLESASGKVVPVEGIPDETMALDIGPETVERYRTALADCGTIVWNGPMGVFEQEAFSSGTMGIARAVADSSALTIVGGGDTDAAVHRSGVSGKISFISTGGGAFLQLLEGKALPGVQALTRGGG
ncbi:MAG: phosphoglycerate kinase [Desulfobacterales bacterium]